MTSLSTPGRDAEGVTTQTQARAQAILGNLDDEQRAAAIADGPALVLGSAGSGRTRVLAHRIAWLIARGAAPARRILGVCRTAREAQLMRARAERLLGAPLHGAWIATAPDICVRILRAHAAALGRRASFTVLDESEARILVRRAAGKTEYSPARLQELIALAKLGGGVPEGEVGEVFRRYEEELAAANAFDAEDLVRNVQRLLDGDPALLAKYQRRFGHIVIDDFEDVTPPVRALIAHIAGAGGDILAAADENQAIASRSGEGGARAAFLAAFPEGRVLALTRGYRTSGRIGHIAARLNPALEAPPKAMRKKGSRVVAAAFADESEEATMVVRWLRRLARRAEVPLRRTAILYRHPIQARPFEEALARAGIPYRVVGAPRFYERREIKDIVAYLRLTMGGGDPAALARIANVPRRGIGPASVNTIAKLSKASKISMAEAALRAASLPRVTAQRAGALADLGRLLTDLTDAARHETCAGLIDYVVERSGYGGLLVDLSRSEEETRREGIDELRGLARALPGPAIENLPALLQRVAPDTVAPVSRGEDGVHLVTIAEAKGHDFDIAFMTGLEEGVIPGVRAIRIGDEAIEAERRLAYVGMTRARNRLILTRAQRRTLFGQTRASEPSRFLGQAGRRVRHFRLGGARPGALPPPSAPVDLLRALREGQRVVHPTYGPGQVTRIESGDKPMVSVRFDAGSEKRLALAFARLQPA